MRKSQRNRDANYHRYSSRRLQNRARYPQSLYGKLAFCNILSTVHIQTVVIFRQTSMQEWDHWRIKPLEGRKVYFWTIGPRIVLGLCFFEYLRVMFGRVLVLASVQVHRWPEALQRWT